MADQWPAHRRKLEQVCGACLWRKLQWPQLGIITRDRDAPITPINVNTHRFAKPITQVQMCVFMVAIDLYSFVFHKLSIKMLVQYIKHKNVVFMTYLSYTGTG